MLPLCETMAVAPGLISACSSTALTESTRRECISSSPMQFGPSSRTPLARASFSNPSCCARPAAPVSAKPSLKMVATGTFFSQHWAIASGTCCAGTMMKAWSTGSVMARRSGYAFSPNSSSRVRLIGRIRPA